MWDFSKAIPVIQAREVAGTKGIFFETFPRIRMNGRQGQQEAQSCRAVLTVDVGIFLMPFSLPLWLLKEKDASPRDSEGKYLLGDSEVVVIEVMEDS